MLGVLTAQFVVQKRGSSLHGHKPRVTSYTRTFALGMAYHVGAVCVDVSTKLAQLQLNWSQLQETTIQKVSKFKSEGVTSESIVCC
eukprot:1080316-Amphidinium_carterae.1